VPSQCAGRARATHLELVKPVRKAALQRLKRHRLSAAHNCFQHVRLQPGRRAAPSDPSAARVASKTQVCVLQRCAALRTYHSSGMAGVALVPRANDGSSATSSSSPPPASEPPASACNARGATRAHSRRRTRSCAGAGGTAGAMCGAAAAASVCARSTPVLAAHLMPAALAAQRARPMAARCAAGLRGEWRAGLLQTLDLRGTVGSGWVATWRRSRARPPPSTPAHPAASATRPAETRCAACRPAARVPVSSRCRSAAAPAPCR
jgi:hypothetical protein